MLIVYPCLLLVLSQGELTLRAQTCNGFLMDDLKILLNFYMQGILGHPDAKELINVGDRYEDTPLHVAAMNGYASVAEVIFIIIISNIYFLIYFSREWTCW